MCVCVKTQHYSVVGYYHTTYSYELINNPICTDYVSSTKDDVYDKGILVQQCNVL